MTFFADPFSRRGRGLALMGGFAVLAPALVSAAVLVLARFDFVELPEPNQTECSHMLASPWGSVVSIVNWPISFVGLAYVAGVAAAWLMGGGVVTPALLYVLRGGALVSVACIALAIAAESFCIYWLVWHAGNLAFGLFAEFIGRRSRMSAAQSNQGTAGLKATVTLGATFALVSALLMVALSEQEQPGNTRLLAIAPKAHDKETTQPGKRFEQVTVAEYATDPLATTADNQPTSKAVAAVGRTAQRPYRLGAESAPLQIVAYLDYQCERSAEIDHKLQELYRRFGDALSIRVRHYPRSTDCNYSQRVNLHLNACQAAKAVEAAGFLRGTNGFWQMHQWLLERNGAFSRPQLEAVLRKQNYEDVAEFAATMEGPQVLRSILGDIVEAESLGIKATPLVMLNGERLADSEPAERLVAAIEARLKQHVETVGSQGDNTDWLPALSGEEDSSETFPKELQASAITATVRIVNDARNSAGSGVIVGARPPFAYVLTAEHVVAGAKKLEVEVFSPQSYPRPSRTYAGARVIATSPRIDAALLQLTGDPSVLNTVQLSRREDSSEQAPFLALSAGCTAEGAPVCRVERVLASKMVRREANVKASLVWEVQSESAQGRSGGALLDGHGRLIGIANGRSEGRGYYCHVLEIRKFLLDTPLTWLVEENSVPIRK